MENSIREQEKAIADENLVAYSRLDFEFHAEVYAVCGNTVLKEMLESIKNKARPLAMRITPILPELLEDHRDIVRALRDRNPGLAEEVFRKHNRKVLALLQAEPEARQMTSSKSKIVEKRKENPPWQKT